MKEMKTFLLFILISQLDLYLSQTALENQCQSTNGLFFPNKISIEECTSITSSCCHVEIKYQYPDLGLIENTYCVVIYDSLKTFKSLLQANLLMDIHRATRKIMNNFNNYQNFLINLNPVNNTKAAWYYNKTLWCPLNCTFPNTTTFTCDTIEDDPLLEAYNLLTKEIEEFYNQPLVNNVVDCSDIDASNGKCISSTTNDFRQLEDSLNYQFNLTKCNYNGKISSDSQCEEEKLKLIDFYSNDYIGNKPSPPPIKPINDCVPIPKLSDLITININCPKDFIESRYLGLSTLLLIMFIVTIL